MVFLNVSESGESIFDTPEVWGGHRSHFRRPSKVRKIVTLCHALSRVKSGPPRYVRTLIRTRVRICTRRPRCRWGPRMDPFLHELSFGPIGEVDVLAELRRFTGGSGSEVHFPKFRSCCSMYMWPPRPHQDGQPAVTLCDILSRAVTPCHAAGGVPGWTLSCTN